MFVIAMIFLRPLCFHHPHPPPYVHKRMRVGSGNVQFPAECVVDSPYQLRVPAWTKRPPCICSAIWIADRLLCLCGLPTLGLQPRRNIFVRAFRWRLEQAYSSFVHASHSCSPTCRRGVGMAQLHPCSWPAVLRLIDRFLTGKIAVLLSLGCRMKAHAGAAG